MQIRLTAIGAALAWSSIAAAAPPPPSQLMQPVDKWQLDFGDTQCTAARSFGDAAGPVVLGIVPALNGSYYKIMVSVPRAGPPYAKEAKGTVDFGRGPIASELLYFGKSGVKQSVYQVVLSAAQMAQAEGATGMTVSADRASYGFVLADVGPLLAGLRECNADLKKYWNMGQAPAVTAGEPLGDIRTVLTARDYPTQAQWVKPSSSVQFQLLIDEKGAIARCDAVAPSGAQVLDSTGCQVIAGRTKFKPAKDAAGKPVRSAWTTPPLVWTGTTESTLDSVCAKMSSDGLTFVNMCGARPGNEIPVQRSLPPPPPPPPSPH